MAASVQTVTNLLRALAGDVDATLAHTLTLRLASEVGDDGFTEVDGGGYTPVPVALGVNLALAPNLSGIPTLYNPSTITFSDLPDTTVTHLVLTAAGKQVVAATNTATVSAGGSVQVLGGTPDTAGLSVQVVSG